MIYFKKSEPEERKVMEILRKIGCVDGKISKGDLLSFFLII